MNSNLKNRYLIRSAADSYWLIDLDLNQSYKPPRQLNETGADMARLIIDGLDDSEIAGIMARELEVDEKELLEDVRSFRQTLALGQ